MHQVLNKGRKRHNPSPTPGQECQWSHKTKFQSKSLKKKKVGNLKSSCRKAKVKEVARVMNLSKLRISHQLQRKMKESHDQDSGSRCSVLMRVIKRTAQRSFEMINQTKNSDHRRASLMPTMSRHESPHIYWRSFHRRFRRWSRKSWMKWTSKLLNTKLKILKCEARSLLMKRS